MIAGSRWRAQAVTLALAVALVGVTACGDDGGGAAPTSTRPPLESPPDPGPVPGDDGLDDETRDAAIASTVRVAGIACGRMSEGSGFAITDSLVATNAHVVVGVDPVQVDLVDGRRLDAEVVAFDAGADRALLRVDAHDLVPLPLGDADDGTVGALIGWEADPAPHPTPFRIDRPITVRIEEVAGVERVERPSWLLAADVESGDSGAALVTADGTVVGVAYATTTRNAGVGYAVRAEAVEALLAAGLSSTVDVPGC